MRAWPKTRRGLLLSLLLLAGTAAFAPPAAADEALWALLKGGGQVIVMRHAATDPGVGDPAGFRLEDCLTQRNLSEAGREEARRVGAAFRARGIPIERVVSSRWCRCLETARLAFGTVEPWDPLNSTFQDKSRQPEQARAFRALAGERRTAGNLVMVSHGTNIVAFTSVYPVMGEMVLLTPRGDGQFTVAGRLPPSAITGR